MDRSSSTYRSKFARLRKRSLTPLSSPLSYDSRPSAGGPHLEFTSPLNYEMINDFLLLLYNLLQTLRHTHMIFHARIASSGSKAATFGSQQHALVQVRFVGPRFVLPVCQQLHIIWVCFQTKICSKIGEPHAVRHISNERAVFSADCFRLTSGSHGFEEENKRCINYLVKLSQRAGSVVGVGSGVVGIASLDCTLWEYASYLYFVLWC